MYGWMCVLRRVEAVPKMIRIGSNLWELLNYGNHTFVQNSRSMVYIVFEQLLIENAHLYTGDIAKTVRNL